jgi:hypothetical protein
MENEFRRRRRVDLGLDSRSASTGRSESAQGVAQRQLRRRRHSGIFEAVHRLDASLDPATRAELAEWIRGQYESEFGQIPLGMFALCHLGPPYIDHRLDLWQCIVEHYAAADLVPEPFNQARMLVRTGAYDFVEVYASGELRPVLKDGSVVA